MRPGLCCTVDQYRSLHVCNRRSVPGWDPPHERGFCRQYPAVKPILCHVFLLVAAGRGGVRLQRVRRLRRGLPAVLLSKNLHAAGREPSFVRPLQRSCYDESSIPTRVSEYGRSLSCRFGPINLLALLYDITSNIGRRLRLILALKVFERII